MEPRSLPLSAPAPRPKVQSLPFSWEEAVGNCRLLRFPRLKDALERTFIFGLALDLSQGAESLPPPAMQDERA